jgi:transposase
MREIVNGIFYVMRAGCPWRLLPNDLPPWGTIYRWFAAWRDDGRFEKINHALVMADRERARPAPRPRSSTAKASRPRRLAGHAVTMLERRSTGASAMRWSTLTGVA